MKKSRLLLLLSGLLLSNLLCAQFSPGTEYIHSPDDPTDLKTGDLDNDGWKDIVVFHSENDEISWFKNLGNGQYAQRQVIGGTINAHSLELIDYDQDGDLDVFAASFYTLVQFTNQGNGTFSAGFEITNQLSVRFISNDVDNDGDIDLILGAYNPATLYFYENIAGTFAAGTVIGTTGSNLKDLRIADLDGDSLDDLITCSEFTNTVAWFKNNGDGSFGVQQVIYANQTQPVTINHGDIDGDGDIDVISANASDVRCYLNQGTGTFGSSLFVSTSIWGVTDMCVKDLDGDQQAEIVLSYYTLPIQSSRLGVFKYTAGSGFSFDSYVSDETNTHTKVIGEDMDNDGDNDILNLNGYSQILLNYNDGTSHFGEDIPFSIFGSPNCGSLVDVDLDGDMDILAENGSRAYWMENLGDSTFGAVYHVLPIPTYLGNNVGIERALMADFDNDGLPDLLYAAYPICYYRNLGNATYASPVYITNAQQNIYDLAIEDFDNDGNLDILAGSNTEAAWYRNNGNNTFSAQTILGTTQYCRAVYASDLDNDGKKDALFVSELDNAVQWCRNLGNSFAAPVTIPTNNIKPNGIRTADLDGDGDLELLVASRDDDKVSWYENLGAGNFGSEHVLSNTFNGGAFDVWSEDFDLDGDKDILTLGGLIFWHENLGNSTFGPAQEISDQFGGAIKLFCGDADLDGDMDILEVNWSWNSIRIYENYNISGMQVKGRLFVDENQNGMYDSNEIAIPQLSIQCNPAAAFTYSYPDGRYFMLFNGMMGNYQVKADSLLFWNTTTPNEYDVVIGPNFTSVNNLNFGFYPDSLVDTLEVALIGGFPRCNEHVNYWFDLENIGTTSPSGIVDIMLDDSLTYVSANLTPDSIVGQHLYWSYDSLDYFETMQIELEVIMPDFNSMGNTLLSTATVLSDTMGTVVFTAVDSLEQVVTCAYDPNDKSASPAGEGVQGYIWPAPEKIEYLIRFQNTGNDTARTVIIRDQLDQNLDWTSLRPIAGSNPYHVEMTIGGEVSFVFENIMLPDSIVNEPASHGFVLYSIDVLPNLALGTVVENTANIYFDFNPAVVTNTVVHTFDTIPSSTAGLNDLEELGDIRVYPNPFDDRITIQTKGVTLPYSVEIADLSGKKQFKSGLILEEEYQFDLSMLTNGVYLMSIKNEAEQVQFVRKVIRK